MPSSTARQGLRKLSPVDQGNLKGGVLRVLLGPAVDRVVQFFQEAVRLCLAHADDHLVILEAAVHSSSTSMESILIPVRPEVMILTSVDSSGSSARQA